MKIFVFDIMLNGRFICTLKYKYCALFPIDFEDLTKFVLKKRPTLKGKDFRIAFQVNQLELSGVPITPEFLKKNGWKKFKRPYSSDYCYRRKGYPTLNIRSEKEVYFHWGDQDESITTVHQLQHLLFGLGLKQEMEV